MFQEVHCCTLDLVLNVGTLGNKNYKMEFPRYICLYLLSPLLMVIKEERARRSKDVNQF